MQDSQFLNARRSISEPPVTLAAPFKLIPEAASGFGIFVSCLVVGGLILLGVLEGFYDMAFGMLLCIAASILVLTTLIWRGARTLYRADMKRKQAEEALRESYDDLEKRVEERTAELSRVNESLRAEVIKHRESEAARVQLLRRLVTAQEDERRRISRELHDQMGQHLAALMLGLKTLSNSAETQTPQHRSLQQLQELTEQLVEKAHHLAWELRPAALDDLGLRTALSNYVDRWSERGGVLADFHSSGLDKRRRLLPQIETTVYRIVQEALTNVLKHARAARVSVILEHRHDQLLTIVEDDGQGFDTEAVRFVPGEGRGLGLLGIRERIALVGGNFNIESQPGAGTTLVIRIPVYTSSEQEVFPREYTAHLLGR